MKKAEEEITEPLIIFPKEKKPKTVNELIKWQEEHNALCQNIVNANPSQWYEPENLNNLEAHNYLTEYEIKLLQTADIHSEKEKIDSKQFKTGNIYKAALSFTKRFFNFYPSKNSLYNFTIKIFQNKSQYVKAIENLPNKYVKLCLPFSDRIEKVKNLVKTHRFQSAITKEVSRHIDVLDIDISSIYPRYPGEIFVLRKPLKVTKNNDDEYHNIDGEAILWPDGSKEYYLYGVKVSYVFFQKLNKNKFLFQDFVNERNEERKNIAIRYFEEKFGNDYVFNFFRKHLEEVNTYVNKKDKNYLKGTTQGMNVGVYTLFKGNITGFSELAFVRCYCPSTDRMFFLGVNPEETNAKDAIASLYRIPKVLVNEIKYIQRQGERFSTVLTEEGKHILQVLGNNTFKEWTTISGDQYFSLMRYEY